MSVAIVRNDLGNRELEMAVENATSEDVYFPMWALRFGEPEPIHVIITLEDQRTAPVTYVGDPVSRPNRANGGRIKGILVVDDKRNCLNGARKQTILRQSSGWLAR